MNYLKIAKQQRLNWIKTIKQERLKEFLTGIGFILMCLFASAINF
jgi:hypothetical protein